MALTDEGSNGMVMPVAPYGGQCMNGGFGGDWGWIILLLLVAGGGFGGFGGFGGGFAADGAALYPWMNQADITTQGFQNQLMHDTISSTRDGVQALATQLCNTGSDIQMALATGFAGVEQGANTRQMANMQQAFAAQTAMGQGFNSVQSQLANCCCENRLATEGLKYTIATENCADRYEAAQNTRDVIENANRNNQAILDKLCELELNAKNDRINDLERQLTMANLAASQTAQTSRILADNAAQTVALEQYLNPVPVPAYVVQNPNCCANGYGMNCGCGLG